MSNRAWRGPRARTVLVVAAALVILLWLGAIVLATLRPEGRPVAAFIGDSYTVGLGASGPEHRWTTLVAREEGWRESNFGEGGSGYITKGMEGTSYLARVDQVIALRPDVVVVAGGQNDISSTGDVAAAVRATLLRLRDGLPDADLYVLGPTWPEPEPPSRLLEVDTAARDAAADVAGRFIPALDLLAGRPELIAADGIHANDAGYQVIADRVVAAVER